MTAGASRHELRKLFVDISEIISSSHDDRIKAGKVFLALENYTQENECYGKLDVDYLTFDNFLVETFTRSEWRELAKELGAP